MLSCSRRVEVNVYVFGERCGRYLMWQYYYNTTEHNNDTVYAPPRTQTIQCVWTNKQMYAHINTILRSKGKFIYILIHLHHTPCSSPIVLRDSSIRIA